MNIWLEFSASLLHPEVLLKLVTMAMLMMMRKVGTVTDTGVDCKETSVYG